MTKSERAKRDIHKIIQTNDLSHQLKRARQESGLAVHPFYLILKEMLVNLDEPDTTMDEIGEEFDKAMESLDPAFRQLAKLVPFTE